jgi:hypothetical protein
MADCISARAADLAADNPAPPPGTAATAAGTSGTAAGSSLIDRVIGGDISSADVDALIAEFQKDNPDGYDSH